MDRSQATFEAYDGVELYLGDRVVRTPAFTVAEAAHFLRMMDRLASGDGGTVEGFVEEFVARAGLGDVRLADLAVACDGLEWGDLTANDAQALLRILNEACHDDDLVSRSRAQVRWLEEIPPTFGLGADMSPADVFQVGHRFAESYYLHMYGLASDFCSRLHRSPAVKTWVLSGPSSSTSGAGTPT